MHLPLIVCMHEHYHEFCFLLKSNPKRFTKEPYDIFYMFFLGKRNLIILIARVLGDSWPLIMHNQYYDQLIYNTNYLPLFVYVRQIN